MLSNPVSFFQADQYSETPLVNSFSCHGNASQKCTDTTKKAVGKEEIEKHYKRHSFVEQTSLKRQTRDTNAWKCSYSSWCRGWPRMPEMNRSETAQKKFRTWYALATRNESPSLTMIVTRTWFQSELRITHQAIQGHFDLDSIAAEQKISLTWA